MEEAEATVAEKAEVEEEEADVTVDNIDPQLQPFNHPKAEAEEVEEAEATVTEVAEVTVVEEEEADVTGNDIDPQLQPFNHPKPEAEEVEEAEATEHPPVYWDLGVGIPGYVLWTKMKVTHLEDR